MRRQADTDLYEALKAGEFCYVLNCRQMGKSSLRVQVMQQLQEEGFICAAIDLTAIGTADVTPEQWYVGMINRIVRPLRLHRQFDLNQWWAERSLLSYVQRFAVFIEEVLLELIPQNIAIFVDEIDSVLSLPFSLDDFFALIRECYNRRADNLAYRRLTFTLLGVTTPADLMRDCKRTPFNIGKPINLTGFSLAEAQPLAEGLGAKSSEPQIILKAVLDWTGGQPFLTQKICKLLLAAESNPEAGQEISWVGDLVKQHIIHNWETQDVPQHLRTIRDRLIHSGEKTGRLLGLYQQILQAGEIPGDDSSEQVDLRLTGLVVNREGKLQVYNPIYAAVFNQDWLERALSNLRPYAESLNAWVTSDRQDESRLLRGQALEDAQIWAADKNLSDIDYRFLDASRELEQREVQQELAVQQQSNQVLVSANRKARKRIRFGLGILVISLVLAGIAFALGGRYFLKAQEANAKVQKAEQELLNINQQKQRLEGDKEKLQTQLGESQGQLNQQKKALKLTQAEKERAQNATQIALQAQRSAEQKLQTLSNQAEEAITQAKYAEDRLQRARSEARRVQRESKFNLINALSISSQSSFDADRSLDALFNSIKAGVFIKQLKGSITGTSSESELKVENLVKNTLQQSVYGAKEYNRLEDGERYFNAVDYSPDGRLIVTGDMNGGVQVWTAEGSLLKRIEGHTDVVTRVIVSPDRNLIASASFDKTIKIWKIDGTLLHVLQGHTTPVNSISFSPDSKTIVSASKDHIQSGEVKIWDVINGQILKTFQANDGGTFAVSFSPDGRTIATGGWDRPPWQGKIRLWNMEGKVISTFSVDTGVLRTIGFSRDGKLIICSGDTGKVQVIQVADGKAISDIKAHKNWALAAQFSPDEKTIASGDLDGELKLWDLKGNLIKQFPGHADAINKVAFSPDGKTLVSASLDRTVKLWRVEGPFLTSLDGNPNNHYLSLSFSPDGNFLASGSVNGIVRVWDKSGTLLKTLPGHNNTYIHTIKFSPDSRLIATASWDGTVKIWKINGDLKTSIPYGSPVNGVGFSPDSKKVIMAGYADSDGVFAKIFDINGQPLLPEIRGHEDQIYRIIFSPDGRLIATASWDRSIKLWNAADGKLIRTLTGHGNWIYGLAFSPDSQILVSGSKDRTVKIWSIDGQLLHSLSGHIEPIRDVTFSSNGQLIASASEDGTVKIWNLNGDLLKTLRGHIGAVYGVSFSPDNKTVASASLDGSIKIWSTEILTSDKVLERGCNLIRDYLKTNPNVEEGDRMLCRGR